MADVPLPHAPRLVRRRMGDLEALLQASPVDGVDLVAPRGATSIAARPCWVEGPACDAADSLFFSGIFGNRISRLARDGSLSAVRADSGRAERNPFDGWGRLIRCEGAERGPGGR